jgi:hypothetical protein
MKRIAILLAAVGLGSGCVVSTTCDPQDLAIDWRFIDVNGTGNLLCTEVPGVINTVDIWVDGARWDTVTCDNLNLGITYANPGTGFHRVVVEGYSGSTLVNRDWADVNVAECGTTSFAANPGEGYLVVGPTSCAAGNGNLLYSLRDHTRSATGYEYRWIRRGSGDPIASFSCVSHVYEYVPFGEYRLNGMENILSTSTTYAYACTPIDFVVDFNSATAFTPDTTYVDVAMTTGNFSCPALY